MAAIASPCNKVCTLDPVSGFCLGCGRTSDEIASWSGLSDEKRETIMQTLPDRLAALRASTSANLN
jgi:predicted Fe-S protein YdhL (DUF1289 family)